VTGSLLVVIPAAFGLTLLALGFKSRYEDPVPLVIGSVALLAAVVIAILLWQLT
jgi:hypothetical protein